MLLVHRATQQCYLVCCDDPAVLAPVRVNLSHLQEKVLSTWLDPHETRGLQAPLPSCSLGNIRKQALLGTLPLSVPRLPLEPGSCSWLGRKEPPRSQGGVSGCCFTPSPQGLGERTCFVWRKLQGLGQRRGVF